LAGCRLQIPNGRDGILLFPALHLVNEKDPLSFPDIFHRKPVDGTVKAFTGNLL
jgi:hypothetical protein